MTGEPRNGDARIERALLDWEASAPRSISFGDVYFSGDGPDETRHVFLAGNDLPARFNTQRFHIGELGFGSGLNFLAAWDAWSRAPKPDGARLHFFSVEAFPFAADDLARAHAAWPQFEPLSAQLRARLPAPHPGFHHVDFGAVSLTLFYGDAREGLGRADGAIDAWFFDGFSPAKNPAMWSPEIFAQAARLSRPGASFATFTVAGAVRHALESAGFTWEKRPGYGRKKDMLAGKITSPPRGTARLPWLAAPAPLAPGARIAIIGAGIAGASLAYALDRAGFAPTLFESAAPASGASGNPAGLIMPRLDAGDTPAGAFHAHAFLHTIRLLGDLDGNVFNPCGVRHHALRDADRDRQEKLEMQGALPAGHLQRDERGLFYPAAGVADPPSFVRALIGDAPLETARVSQMRQHGDGWRVITPAGDADVDAVVIANGLDALRFATARTLPLTGSAGQIDWFPDAARPAIAEAFGPYAAPAPGGGLVIGATYAPIAIGAEAQFTREATESNIAAIARTLPDLAARLEPGDARPRASIRCTTPDRMPVAGPLPDWGFYGGAYDGLRTGAKREYPEGVLRAGLFILSGLGSRGLVTAPYAAALMAAEMAGAARDSTILQAIHPARFFIRDLKRAGAR